MTGVLEPGRMIGRYRILRVLGSGAMGDVYLAEDPQIERQLAIKTVRVADGKPEDVEDRKRRLLREAKAAGKLIHPHVVTLFDAGEGDGVLYLAFEYVAGSDLAKRMEAEPPLTLAEVLRIVRESADALDAAHHQGIVHRDVKPANIMLDLRGRVKVADFGIAKVVGQGTELTMTGSVVGSPHYLSPEQVRGEELDGRTDIFSLGVVLYELLGHRRPFAGETLTTLVYQILHQEPAPIASLRPDLAPRLEQLLRRMLAKDREQRFPDAASVVAEITALERSLPSDALAAPAAEVGALDKTHRMPSSGGATAAPRTGTAPTAIANAPTSLTGLPASPAAVAPASPAAGLATAPRKSPLPWILAGAAVFLVAIAALGWFVVRPMLFHPAVPPSTQQVSADAPPTTKQPAQQPSTSSPSTTSPSTTSPATTNPQPQRSAEKPATSQQVNPAAAPTTPATQVPQTQVPPPTNPPVTQKPTTAPVVPVPSSPHTTAPVSHPTTQPSNAENGEEEALPPLPPGTREISSGLVWSFDVKPESTIARYTARSDGSKAVLGAVEGYTGKRNSQAYTLPEAGDYLLQFLDGGGSVHASFLVHARAGNPSKAFVFDLTKPLPSAAPAQSSSGGARRVKERLVLKIDPSSATVYVDNAAVGAAKDFSGGFSGNKVLQLTPGSHKIRFVAAGYVTQEVAVEVTPSGSGDPLRLDLAHE